MEILEQFKKRKGVIIISTVSAAILGLLLSMTMKPSYIATVEIAMQPTDVIHGFAEDKAAVSEYSRYQIEIIKSEEIVNDAIDKLHLRMSNVLDTQNPEESFLKHIKVMLVGNSLIKITATAKTPQLAAGMASQLANSFVGLHKEQSLSISKKAMDWLSESSKIAKDLNGAENKLLTLVKNSDLQEPSQRLEQHQQNTDKLVIEKTELTGTLKDNENIYQELVKQASDRDTSELLAKPLDPVLLNLLGEYRREYMSIQPQLDQLLERYKEHHPRVVELKNRKDLILKKAKISVKEILNRSKEQIDYASKRLEEVNGEIEKHKVEYTLLLDRKKEHDLLKSKVDNLKMLYKKGEEELKTGGFSVISVSMLGFTDKGGAPVTKSKPFETFLIGFSLVGLLIGMLISFFLDRSSVEKKIPSKST